jgi:hypothetical protein
MIAKITAWWRRITSKRVGSHTSGGGDGSGT